MNFKGKNNPFYGKKHSIESRKKISIARQKEPLKKFFCIKCSKEFLTKARIRKYCDKCKIEAIRDKNRRADKKRTKNPKRIIQVRISKKRYRLKPETREKENKYRRESPVAKAISKISNLRRRERLRGVIKKYTRKDIEEKIKNTKGICPLCKKPFSKEKRSKNELTIHHNPPLFKVKKGFKYKIENIEIECRSCNSKKNQYT